MCAVNQLRHDTKVAINHIGGYRNTVTFVLTGLDVEAKAELVCRSLFDTLGGQEAFAEVDVDLARTDQPDAATLDEASTRLRVTVKDRDPARSDAPSRARRWSWRWPATPAST